MKRYLAKYAIALCIGLHCSNTLAISLEFPVDKLVDSSSDVATIDIVEGRIIERDGILCGYVFTARVKETLKGSHAEVVVFGSNASLEIGKRYFTVLIPRSKHIQDGGRLLPAVANYYRDETKAASAASDWELCKEALPPKMVAAFGEAAMPVELPPEMGYLAPAVKVPLSIWLPPGTKCMKALSVSDHDKGRWVVWISPEELRRVFRIAIDRPIGTKIVGGPGKYAISPSDCDEPRSPKPAG